MHILFLEKINQFEMTYLKYMTILGALIYIALLYNANGAQPPLENYSL